MGSGDNDAFPAVVYLTLNQLDYVQFTNDAKEDGAKEEAFKVGDQLIMGGVEYVIERMGDIVECKQPGDGGDFPKVVFLAMRIVDTCCLSQFSLFILCVLLSFLVFDI